MMGIILKPFGDVLNPSVRSVPMGRLDIDWSHPLARGLIGCWVPGIMGGMDVTRKTPNLSWQPASNVRVTSDGFGLASTKLTDSGLAGVAPDDYKSWTELTIYWRGTITAADWYAYHIGIDYSNPRGSPWTIANLQDHYQNDYINPNWNMGGSLKNNGVAIPYGAGLRSIGATFVVGGSVYSYDNGLSLGSVTFGGTSGPTSTTTSRIAISGLDSTCQTGVCNLACFWNRALSADEMAWLDSEAYSFLLPAEGEMRMLGGLPTISLTQSHFRFRTDANAVDATPTWGANEDAA